MEDKRRNKIELMLSDDELHALQETAKNRRWSINDVIRFELFMNKRKRSDVADAKEFIENIVEEMTERIKENVSNKLQEIIDEVITIRYLNILSFFLLKLMLQYDSEVVLKIIRAIEYLYIRNAYGNGVVTCFKIDKSLEEIKNENLIESLVKKAHEVENSEDKIVAIFSEFLNNRTQSTGSDMRNKGISLTDL